MSRQANAAGATARRRGPQGASRKPVGAFGGFRKRTISAYDFAAALASIAADAPLLYRIWARHELDPGFREELMLAVSRFNECRYCSWAHHEWASIDGVPEQELAQIERGDPPRADRRKWLAIAYVRELAATRFGAVPNALVQQMQAGYTPREIEAITLVARVMDAANLGANTFDAMRSRLRGVPAKESRLFDELILSAVFLCVAPPMALFLARLSKRSFGEMLRRMSDYTRHMETSR